MLAAQLHGKLTRDEENLEDLKESLRGSNRERVMEQLLEQIRRKLQAHNGMDWGKGIVP